MASSPIISGQIDRETMETVRDYFLGLRRTDAFELWCWRRLLRVSWIARRSNQSILKEISPNIGRTDAEAEAPVLWPADAKSQLIRKDPAAGKD